MQKRIQDRVLVSEIHLGILKVYDRVWRDIVIELQQAGVSFHEPTFRRIQKDFDDWVHENGGIVNVVADTLWHFSRHGEYPSNEPTKTLARIVAQLVESTLSNGITLGNFSLHVFMERARGNRIPLYGGTRRGGIKWNNYTRMFETKSWGFDSECREDLPKMLKVLGN